jgi:hypothetical protein
MPKKLKELPFDEIVEYWNDDKDGEYIQVDGNEAAFIAHGRVVEKIGKNYGNIFAGIRAWCEEHQYWPNVWSVNDHGNVSLYDKRGNYLGGIV